MKDRIAVHPEIRFGITLYRRDTNTSAERAGIVA